MEKITASKPGGKTGRAALLAPLTTFRFFAALSVVCFHSINNHGNYGYLASGVSFFFILSGFVLTYVHPRVVGTAEFIRFWIARLARIWPLHLFTLAVVLIHHPFGSLPYKHFTSELFLNTFLLQCWIPVGRIAQSFNFVSWTLSIELFFYTTFPFLLPLVWKAPWKMIVGSLLLYVVAAWGAAAVGLPDISSANTPTYGAFFYCPLLHLYEFVLGMAMAVLWSRFRHSPKPVATWSGIEVLTFGALPAVVPHLKALSLLLTQGHTQYKINDQVCNFLIAAFFALVIFVFAFQAGVLSRFFSQGWLVYLGEISFSVYMVHCLILIEFQNATLSIHPIVKWSLFGLALLSTSSLLYTFLEKPSRKLLVRAGNSFLNKPPTPASL